MTDNNTRQDGPATSAGTDDAKKAAQERMQAALEAKKRGQEIQVDSGGLESADNQVTISDNADDELGKSKQKGDGKTIDKVKIYSPFKVYYDGSATSGSAVNLTGPFDILHDHKNFMSLLIKGDIVVRSDSGEETIKIERGVMHVSNNTVVVFLDV